MFSLMTPSKVSNFKESPEGVVPFPYFHDVEALPAIHVYLITSFITVSQSINKTNIYLNYVYISTMI